LLFLQSNPVKNPASSTHFSTISLTTKRHICLYHPLYTKWTKKKATTKLSKNRD